MKKGLFIMGVLLLFSCAKQEIIVYTSSTNSTSMPIETRGYCDVDSTFLVTLEDAQLYTEHQLLAHNNKQCLEIIPNTYKGFPTSYTIQYEDGWEIISADKRGPVVLAVSKKGRYEEDSMPPAERVWLTGLNEEVAVRWEQHLPLDSNNEKEIESLNYWANLIMPRQGALPSTRVENPGLPLGQLVLISEEHYPEVYDSIPHLITTHWHQRLPYNNACPFKTDSVSRALAGCVPVAGAQALNYYHQIWGVPELAPSYASCTGILNNAVFDIPEPNSATIWNQFYNVGYLFNMAYILIADVGVRCGANYGDDGTGAYAGNLISVFDNYGLSSTFLSYKSSNLIKASLLSNQVIVTGADCYETGGEEFGHEFLIDGYIRYRERIVSHYRWIYDPPMLIPEDDMEVIVYSSPEIELIKMNWGWNSDDDDASFAITGSWSLDDGTCYDHDFTMIYNFAIKDE